VDDDGATAVLLGTEAHTLRARAHDLAEVQPAEVEEAPHRSCRERTTRGAEEGRRYRLEVESYAIVFESHVVLALLQRPLLEGQ